MKRREPGIQQTILLWMLVLTIVPIIIVSYQGFHCAKQALIETNNAHLHAVLTAKKTQIERTLDVVRSDLHLLSILTFSNTPNAEKGCCQSPSCVCNPLTEALGKKNYYQNLISFNSSWKITGSAQPIQSPFNLPKTFRKQLESATGLVFSNLPDSGKKLEILTGCPLSGTTDKQRGYIAGSINLTPIIQPVLADLTGLGKSGRIFFITPSGKTIQEKNGTVQLQAGNASIQKIVSGVPDETSSPVILSIPGKGRILVSSTKIPTLKWRMFLLTSYSETFNWLKILQQRAFLTGILVILLVLLVAMRLSKNISSPFRVLSETANRIASGQVTSRVPPLRGREAADLATAFNRMMDSLSSLQQQLAQTASLAAIGELTSSVVHEMRNPLSSIKMNLQALREKVKSDPDYAELSDIALSQAFRLETMLSELLTYGKPTRLHPTHFPLAGFIEACVSQLIPLAGKKRIEIQEHSSLPPSQGVFGDRELLMRAIVNLIGNAIEASAPGTRVTITVNMDPTSLCFVVEDEGPGIPAAIAEEIFNPFVTSKENGTGLGLANVKKIALLHGGSVRGENLTGKGARFTLCIPKEGKI